MSQPLHLTGTIVVGDGAELDECWVVDGRLTLDPPVAPAREIEGWVLPGLVDVHCHIGLGPQGAVSTAEAEVQAKYCEPSHPTATTQGRDLRPGPGSP